MNFNKNFEEKNNFYLFKKIEEFQNVFLKLEQFLMIMHFIVHKLL
jgi:hypothetical protein